jgi:hypothetical protein
MADMINMAYLFRRYPGFIFIGWIYVRMVSFLFIQIDQLPGSCNVGFYNFRVSCIVNAACIFDLDFQLFLATNIAVIGSAVVHKHERGDEVLTEERAIASGVYIPDIGLSPDMKVDRPVMNTHHADPGLDIHINGARTIPNRNIEGISDNGVRT